jgi:hypothetical protein
MQSQTRSFKQMVTILKWFTNIFLGVFFIAFSASFIAIFVGFFISKDAYTFTLDELTFIQAQISQSIFIVLDNVNGTVSLRSLLIFGGLVGSFFMAFLALSTWFLRGILKDLLVQTPFTKANANRLLYMAFTFIIGSVILPIVQLISGMQILKNITTPSFEYQLTLDTNLLFFGLLILVLGKIFDYGLSLQTEVDETV